MTISRHIRSGASCSLSRRQRRFLRAAAAVLLLAGCGEPASSSATIEGTAFVVTRGAENVRLGLVEVGLYPDSTITPRLSARAVEAAANYPDLLAIADSLGRIASARTTDSEAARRLAELRARALDVLPPSMTQARRVPEASAKEAADRYALLRSLAEAFRDAEQPPAVPKIIIVIVEPDGTVGGEMHWEDGRFVSRMNDARDGMMAPL